jgi:hypothetical protein
MQARGERPVDLYTVCRRDGPEAGAELSWSSVPRTKGRWMEADNIYTAHT